MTASNKGMKQTKSVSVWSFAAYPRCCADRLEGDAADDRGMSKQLPDDLHAQIITLSEQGNELVDSESFSEARAAWQMAWDLLPEPPEQWEAATWLLTSIGDAYYREGLHADALEPLQRAVSCPGGLGNPFLHLRLGQVQFELGNMPRAQDELARAFMGGGDELFEAEDPKYWQFIREILRPPVDEVGE